MNKEMRLAMAEMELAKAKAAITVLSQYASPELQEILNKAAAAIEKAENQVVIEQMQ